MQPIKLNNKPIEAAIAFAFDGCHKVYLLKGPNDIRDALRYDYTIYPISELEETFSMTCSLRFVSWWHDFEAIIPQFANKVVFKYANGAKRILDFTSDFC